MSTSGMLAVVDIDGVLADVRHRLHFVEQRPKDWDGFFAAALEDPVLPQGVDVVRQLAQVHEVVYLSGRPEKCREDTLAWLAEHDIPPGEVFLRRPGDRRPARLTKIELLDRLRRRKPIAVLVDDDPQVCEAARAAGYDVLPATWMEPDPTLQEVQEVEGRS